MGMGLVAEAIAQEVTAAMGGRPAITPSGSGPRSGEMAARVTAELIHHATPE